ncbi:MAG: biotin transporter BioY [Clostridia bacterium]|nr:biotin transporter BioY [Clostridia bacterium]
MALSALMAAALCILAPLSIPIGPVPITLSVLAIMLMPYLSGMRLSVLAVVLYLALGALGLPVFSGFEGGVQKLVGPTGGFLVGYIPLALIAGLFVDKSDRMPAQLLGLALGLFACYALGTVWLALQMRIDLSAALGAAVLPFLPLDAVKLVTAAVLGPQLKKRLKRSNACGD